MNNYSAIAKKMRNDKKLSLKKASILIGKSAGWLSQLENNKLEVKLDLDGLKFIAECYGLEGEMKRYFLWASGKNNKQAKQVWYEGAIYKHMRLKSKFTLKQASQFLGVSKGQLANIEACRRSVSSNLKENMLAAYGFKKSSFQNYIHREERIKSIPVEFRIKLLMQNLKKEKLEQIFEYAQVLNNQN